jgi:hypothetical protein
MPKWMKRVHEWFTLADYEAEKTEATEQVVRRFTRGNVSVQNGWFLNERDLDELSNRGDKALARLNKKVGRTA